MLKFVDREKELEALENEYNRNQSALVVLYGRRRVGKTSLCTEFIKNKAALYFLATEESDTQNRNTFKAYAAEFTGNELLAKATVDNWDIIFKTIIEYRTKNKKVIVMDEFQYLGKNNSAFLSVFQRIWDTILKDKNIMVILCGSLVSMMENQTLHYSSPLYGRRTAQIKLKQVPFAYYNEFFKGKTDKELIELYSVTGGVPKYVELFEDNNDIYSAINKNVLNKLSFLYDEPNFLLSQEVSEVGSYFSIVKTIAQGNQKLSKIATSLELPQTSLTKYLKTLIDLDILVREVPVTEKSMEKSKKGLYKIKDNFILFWFKFIYPNLGFIESGHEQMVMNKIKESFIDNHVSFVYEDICREKMWELAANGKIQFSKVGRFWDNNGNEIDIVALDEGNITFGECKYSKHKIGINILSGLEQKAKLVEHKAKNIKYTLFSISGYTEDLLALAEERNDVILM